ncbi:hypothetical protein [Pantoea ananatis]|uniref:hypothetical protein n=1 Tax=Pantoea ananas TaxID=553 RepID=UPI00188F6D39|nr:hypothetical protein [Pantoea ananatis]
MNKIWRVRPSAPSIGRSYWKSVVEQVEFYGRIDAHIDVYYLHRETEKCFYVTARNDDHQPYRQLKEDGEWFHSEDDALQYLSKRIAEHREICLSFADAFERLMLEISLTQDAIAEKNHDN